MDNLHQVPIFKKVKQLGGGGDRVKFCFGSLKSVDTAEELVYEILYQVVRGA